MKMTEKQKETDLKRPIEWVKDLLNNTVLLKWVKKFSADGINDNNNSAEKMDITCSEGTISVMDTASIKMLVTQARYEGNIFNRLSLEHVKEIIDCVGSSGDIFISNKAESPVFIQTENVVVVLAPKQLNEDDNKEQYEEQPPSEPKQETETQETVM